MCGSIGRRGFLATGVAAALAGVFAAGRRVAHAAGCDVREDNPEGPFYIPGAPFRSQLAPPGEPGEPLRITGRVLGGPGCEPLDGATVDVWHASSDGFYSGLEATRPLAPEQFHFRGRILTGPDGGYAFDTILPGWYRVTRDWARPRHIHYKVSHPSHRGVTTQLYFEGDPRNADDALVKRSLIIPLRRVDRPGGPAAFAGTFDIVLARA